MTPVLECARTTAKLSPVQHYSEYVGIRAGDYALSRLWGDRVKVVPVLSVGAVGDGDGALRSVVEVECPIDSDDLWFCVPK